MMSSALWVFLALGLAAFIGLSIAMALRKPFIQPEAPAPDDVDYAPPISLITRGYVRQDAPPGTADDAAGKARGGTTADGGEGGQ